MRAVTVFAVLALFAGCKSVLEPHGQEIEVRTDRLSYSFGDSVHATVVNRGDDHVELTGCYGDVEYLTPAGWRVSGTLISHCLTFPGHRIAPAESLTISIRLKGELFTPGRYYRLHMRLLNWPDAKPRPRSNFFVIGRVSP
jgi:hypothetical protein